ncbi:CRE-SPE-38 protein [Caenorhabditis remanei]|uniref:CRE-SPE-38 protein n=1 Tax=Caenorhabditis remanei TaxID=31234 RepID=E3M8U6_CAERE|nr:CRE-SPE-38 protein [Caenorhabditis remanei]
MRNLVELGSPSSVYYTVFCCSHVIIAFFIFMILDLTLTLFSLFFELFVIFYRDVPDQIWAIFHGASLITMVSGFFAICVGQNIWKFVMEKLQDNPSAIIFFGCRVSLILAVTIARFIISINEFKSREEPTLQELLSLFQIIPVVIYTIGLFLVIRLFSFSTGRYRGYHDVDEDLRLEVRRKYEEFEASIDAAPKED